MTSSKSYQLKTPRTPRTPGTGKNKKSSKYKKMVERIRDDLNIQIEILDEEKTTSDSIQEPLKSTKNET